jgi:NADH:ubiquinone reductase (H+-translocating)
MESLGVEVRLGQAVYQIDTDGVIVSGERIYSKTVIWTAGVAPSSADKGLPWQPIEPAVFVFKTISP